MIDISAYEQAPCVGVPVELFYDSRYYYRVIKVCCAQCPVKELCLQDCLELEDVPVDGKHYRSGVFGGLTPADRNRLCETKYDILTDNWEEKYADSNCD